MTGLMDYGERKKLFRGGLRHGFGDRKDLLADGGAHVLRKQVLFGSVSHAATVRSVVSVTIGQSGSPADALYPRDAAPDRR